MSDSVSRLSAALRDRYLLERELGQGGMATVYLAHDVKHDRKVALKVMRPELAAIIGAERFLSEIKTTANLQHPNILPLFDSGEVDGVVFYVMPFVEGESLRERLTRERQLPVDDAVRITLQMLDALEYAHEQGIIHRDVKPENILLRGNHALVADFGIALAFSRSDAGRRLTETGLSLGTPAYMSPEQAMGERAITARSDVYSVGCVLYEMLLGTPPFGGPSAQAIIARVLTERPRPVEPERHTVPSNVAAAVEQALEKLPADRFVTAQSFAAALNDPAYTHVAVHAPRPRGPRGGWRARTRTALPWVLAAAATLVAGIALTRGRHETPPVGRFVLSFASGVGPADEIAVSPDGAVIVYVGNDTAGTPVLYRRALDHLEPQLLSGTSSPAFPFFSPDGKWLGFWQGQQLMRMPADGGGISMICEVAPGDPRGATWLPDDHIAYSTGGRLFTVTASGGQPVAVPVRDTAVGAALVWPDALPGGREVLVASVRGTASHLYAVSLSDGQLTDLHLDGYAARWVTGGYLAFIQSDRTVAAVRFDARALRVTGVPRNLNLPVPFDPDGEPIWAVGRNGTLAGLLRSSPFTWTSEGRLVRVSRRGTVEPMAGLPLARYQSPRISPNGTHLAVAVIYPESELLDAIPRSDIWSYDLRSGTGLRLSLDSVNVEEAWSPDGATIVFSQTHPNSALLRVAADGSGGVQRMRTQGGYYDVQFAATRPVMVFRRPGVGDKQDIWIGTLSDSAPERALTETPFDERWLALSPDGRWLAYTSDETGARELYVRTLDRDSPHWRVSTHGASEPRWAHSGRELFFRNGDTVYVAPVLSGAPFHAGPPRALFVGTFSASGVVADYDVMPDDHSLLMIQPLDSASPPNRLELLLNWFESARADER